MNIDPSISFDEKGFGCFTFPETPAVVAVVMGYESDLQVNAREVLNTRNELFIPLYERVVSGLAKKGYTDTGATGCTRWLRLPMGRNLKEKHRIDGLSPEVKLVECNLERRYAFGKFLVDMGEVLLLSLEDNERRLKGRLKTCMAGENKDLSNFHASTVWKRLDQGGLEELANWLELHPDCKLVVIDTMQKIKAHPKRKNGNAYENDYDSYGDLQRLALHHRCCILVIHHNRKSDSRNDADPLEAISGSTGVEN